MNYSETEPKGIIKYKYTNKEGVKIYEARIETIIFDHSPRNPSLPVINSVYNGKPTCAYSLTYDEAINHIRSFGFDGEIATV